VMVHSAGIQDQDGAKQVLTALVARCPGLQLIWADGGYAGKLVTWVATVRQRTLVIVKRPGTPEVFRRCNGAGSWNARSAGSIARGG
jgi:hypothetical protein